MYTLADLTRMAGIKRRTVQLWAEGGVLIAESATERQGSGVHRAFSRDEAIICLILSRFAQWNMSIGRLEKLAIAIREHFLQNPESRAGVEQCIRGEETIRVTVESAGTIVMTGGIDNNDRLAAPLARLGTKNETMIGACIDGALAALRSEPKD
jgi:DNA-binding transcriptional MerR regulator